MSSYLRDPFMCELEWNAIRSHLLLRALRVKFQDPHLARMLVGTGETHIVCYSTPRTGKPSVQRHVGRALEVVRNEIRQEVSQN